MDQVHPVSSKHKMPSELPYTFNRKLMFTTNQNLVTSRSRNLEILLPTAAVTHTDLWEIKPPDFSPKFYRTLNLPRIKKKMLDSSVLKEGLEELSQSLHEMPPIVQLKQEEKRNMPVFFASYKPPGLLELQMEFVKSGQFPSCPYKNPKPHNFRPCDENLTDMVTSKDPERLTLSSQLLEARVQPEADFSDGEQFRKIITFKPAEPKWDSGLILPKSPWPPVSAAYTRHRRRKGVYNAFLDRVEEKLTRSWMK